MSEAPKAALPAESRKAIRERIWFLEGEAKTMREEAKRLRALLKKPALAEPTAPR